MSEIPIEKRLTNRQKVFVNEYLKSFNATESAKKAGYSAKTAYSSGARLLKDVDIAEALRLRLSETAMSAEEVLRRLADIARGDIADLMSISTVGYNLELLDYDRKVKEQTKLIKKIKQKVTTIANNKGDDDKEIVETEIELYSAQEALNTLAKYHGLLVDRTDLTSGGEPITIKVKYDDK